MLFLIDSSQTYKNSWKSKKKEGCYP